MCGLKQNFEQAKKRAEEVTPFVGVWIETGDRVTSARFAASHPSWVCGLKLLNLSTATIYAMSHPSWVCGLKLFKDSYTDRVESSHPSWVCGLKQLQA